MSKQYNTIGSRYSTLHDLPFGQILVPSTARIIGDIRGQKCLDLACGLGNWSKFLIENGASKVVGVDISEGMIEVAKKEVDVAGVEFLVADCSKSDFKADEGGFEFVLGSWFLNYAPTYEALVNSFKSISNNLTPGGRFVGVTINTHCPMFEPFHGYGLHIIALGPTSDGSGVKCQITADTEPESITFECYHLLHDKYEAAAKEAGLGEVKWHGYVLPQDERLEKGYWDAYQLRGHFNILSCYKD